MDKQLLGRVALLAGGLAAMAALPRMLPKMRQAARRATGRTYRTGPSFRSRAMVDPAHARPA